MKTETKINLVFLPFFMGTLVLCMGVFLLGIGATIFGSAKLFVIFGSPMLTALRVRWGALGFFFVPVMLFTIFYFVVMNKVLMPAVDRFLKKVYGGTENWFKYRWHHVVRCSHNGIIGIAPYLDFNRSEDAFRKLVRAGKAAYSPDGRPQVHKVENVMTFSDRKELQGKVTGTLADLAELTKDCWIGDRTFMIPGTSTASLDMQPISFEKGYEIVHGRSR